MYPFITFESHDGVSIYTKCVKYLTLQVYCETKSSKAYYINFDNKSIKVSKEVYGDVQNVMVECNNKFDRANLGTVFPASC